MLSTSVAAVSRTTNTGDLPSTITRLTVSDRLLPRKTLPKHWTNHARCDLAIEVDPATARLTGKAKMTCENRSPDPIRVLVIHLYQDMMRQGRERTRTIVPTGGFEIGEVRRAVAWWPVRPVPGSCSATPKASMVLRREGQHAAGKPHACIRASDRFCSGSHHRPSAFLSAADSGLRVNLHLHVLWLDGVFAHDRGPGGRSSANTAS
ncbi:MAG TPA: hypothetical protein VFZ65_23810 [Planctomycetota bacterium]|nr:hypothetical protein [Planctomycetota bacterium]